MNNVEKLPPEIKTIWRISAILDFAIILIIAAGCEIGSYFVAKSMTQPLLVAAIVFAVLAIVVLIAELALVPYHWNFWTYYIDDRQVEIHHGFFFRKQIIIPIARIQNVTIKQSPILRWKNLQKVVVETAAGGHSIAGLRTEKADDLKELIMKLAREARNDI